MRSRNGDYSLLRFGCVLALCTALYGDEYLIGYRLTTQDAAVASERLHVSAAMQPCNGTKEHPLILEGEGDLPMLLAQQRDAFDAYLQRYGYHVTHREYSVNHATQSRTDLTFPTACFEVEFKAGFATIALIK